MKSFTKTIMLPIGKEHQGGFRVIQPREVIQDSDGNLWRCTEKNIFGYYDVYATEVKYE